jgi:hypothetical protein
MTQVLNIIEFIILASIGKSLSIHYNFLNSTPYFQSQEFPEIRLILDLTIALALGIRIIFILANFNIVNTKYKKLYLPLALYSIGISFDMFVYIQWKIYAGMYGRLIFIYSIPIFLFIGRIILAKKNSKYSLMYGDILDAD